MPLRPPVRVPPPRMPMTDAQLAGEYGRLSNLVMGQQGAPPPDPGALSRVHWPNVLKWGLPLGLLGAGGITGRAMMYDAETAANRARAGLGP
jgi:hypothetical protein